MVCDVPGQFSFFVVVHELRKGLRVEGDKYVRQFLRTPESGRKSCPIMLAKGPDQCVAMFLADLAVLITMTVMKTWLVHEGSVDTRSPAGV